MICLNIYIDTLKNEYYHDIIDKYLDIFIHDIYRLEELQKYLMNFDEMFNSYPLFKKIKSKQIYPFKSVVNHYKFHPLCIIWPKLNKNFF